MIGKLIGNYRITAELAQGGMGAVYRGRHQNLPREVVVKVILLSSFPPGAQEHLKARFVREAYVQSQLDHPNIVRVFEFFTTEENYYLVMEFVDGMSLRDLLKRRGALDQTIALPLFKQALGAIAYAHDFKYVDEGGRHLTGVTHRDIKPANLLLDGMARLKLTDFGIVKLSGESSMTQSGFNPGTHAYMSPEQIRGDEVDSRSDIYSLGVTFYEALAGRLPFPPSDTGSEYEVLKGHMELAPPPLLEVRPTVPPALAALVMRALQKDPADRWQKAEEWLDALLAYEHGGSMGYGTESAAAPINIGSQPQVTERLSEGIPSGVPAMPSRQKSGIMPLVVVATVVLVLIGVATAGYLVLLKWSRRTQNVNISSATPSPSAATTTATVTVTATPVTVAPEDERLRQAHQAEQDERYAEAIKLYREYVDANPRAADAVTISTHVSELKDFAGRLQMARVWMDQKDFAEARKDYAAALKLRPDSKAAREGLARADARLTRSP
jgi:serine/threonine-protein kinase